MKRSMMPSTSQREIESQLLYLRLTLTAFGARRRYDVDHRVIEAGHIKSLICGTGCAADRIDHHQQKSGPLQAIAGHIQGVQCRQNIPSVATRKSRDEKSLTTEPEKEKFVIDGICALVIGYEVLVKQ